MIKLTLSELVRAVNGEFLLGDPRGVINAVSIDTRSLRKGDYFFALSGKNFDGHNYLIQAIEKGAAGLVVSRKDIDIGNPFPAPPAIVCVKDTQAALGDLAAFLRRKWDIPVVAVTGSNGKTTTKEMLSSILRQKGPALSTSGNLNNQIGLPLTIFNLNKAHEFAIVEMGTSWPGEIGRLAKITAPDIGIITNIGMTHLENFKTDENVFKEKSELIDALPASGTAVLNADDPFLAKAAARLGKKAVTFGIENKADVTCKNLKLWPGNPAFELVVGGRAITTITLPVFGRFNVYNALAAAAAAWKLGMSPVFIKNGLESFVVPNMRMNVINLISGATLVVDAYNANPSSMQSAMRTFAESFQDRDKVAVLGDMLELGDASREEHKKLGQFVDMMPFSHVHFFGPMSVFAHAAVKEGKSTHHENKDHLINDIKNLVSSNTAVFFKASRGMHFEEIIDALLMDNESAGKLDL